MQINKLWGVGTKIKSDFTCMEIIAKFLSRRIKTMIRGAKTIGGKHELYQIIRYIPNDMHFLQSTKVIQLAQQNFKDLQSSYIFMANKVTPMAYVPTLLSLI